MIRIVKKGEKLSEADVIGKYVLQELPYHFMSLGKPRIATKISGSRIYIDRERPILKDGLTALTGNGEREADGYVSLFSIRCVCETPDEVNAIVDASRRTMGEFNEFKARAVERVEAFDGMSIDAQFMPVPR